MTGSGSLNSTDSLLRVAEITTTYTLLVVPSTAAAVSLIYYKELGIRRIVALAALAYTLPIFVWTTYVWFPKLDDAVGDYISTLSFRAPDEDAKAFRGAIASMPFSTRIVSATMLSTGHLCIASAAWCIAGRWLPSRHLLSIPSTLRYAFLSLCIFPFPFSSYFLTGIAAYCAARARASPKLLHALVKTLQLAESSISTLNAAAVNLSTLVFSLRTRNTRMQIGSRNGAAKLLILGGVPLIISVVNTIDSAVTQWALSRGVEMTPAWMLAKVAWMCVSYNVSIFCELALVTFALTARRSPSQSGGAEGAVLRGASGSDIEAAWKVVAQKIEARKVEAVENSKVEVVRIEEKEKESANSK